MFTADEELLGKLESSSKVIDISKFKPKGDQ